VTTATTGPLAFVDRLGPDGVQRSCMTTYLSRLERDHPTCHALVDSARVEIATPQFDARHSGGSSEFLDEAEGGRGVGYRQAQRVTLARARGARALLGLFEDPRALPGPLVILDVLGGDGLVARIAAASAFSSSSMTVVTSDLAPTMVAAALAAGHPAVWQAAQRLILRDDCVDGVLCAYGTHHLDRTALIEMCEEARRVIRPGGRIVVHDFEPDSAVARWFGEVVHRYSRNGHDYEHYGASVLSEAISGRGFEDVASRPLVDPIVTPGSSPEGARLALARYLFQMYGLVGLGDGKSIDVLEQVLSFAESCFGPIEIGCTLDQTLPYNASLPRVAVFAVGTVPAL
jgi:SAM-dependent methyltransferase